MKTGAVSSSNLGDDWTAEHHLVQAEEVSTHPHVEGTDSMTAVTPETCWKKGCEAPAERDYWCEPHHTERRERIRKAMLELRTDSYGIPRNHGGVGHSPVAHDVTMDGDFYGWKWSCSCGKGSAAYASTKGHASAGAARHIRSIRKAAA